MFLKFISIPDFDFQTSYKNGIYKIKSLSLFDKIFTIFWLLGPFVFLIERDPADFWLSFIGLVFLIRSFIVKDWSWANQTWFKLALILWLISLISALANNNTITSDNITNKKITTANKINSNINLLYIYTHKTHKTNSHKTSNYKCYT